MIEFKQFEAGAPVPEQTIATFERWPGFPPEIIDLWRTYGTGFVGPDGFIRIIDPAQYLPFLPEWFNGSEGAIPFLASGMGDLYLWQMGPEEGGIIRQVLYRYGEVRRFAPQFDRLFASLEDPIALQAGYLLATDYPAGVERLGRPDLYEAFFYTPYLAAGGPEVPERLNRGGMAVTVSIFTQMFGKLSLIPPDFDPSAVA